MDRIDRYLASLTEEGRYRLLIEAVTDYAIWAKSGLMRCSRGYVLIR
jgi:hypothetical protein